MNYFKVNYSKLERLKQTNFSVILWIISLYIIFLLILSIFIKTSKSIMLYGIIDNNIVKIKINNELSDVVKNNEYILVNKKKIKYQVDSFGEIEIIDNNIIQNINLTIDEKFMNNEVIKIILRYDKKRLIKHILDLFK